MRVFVVMGNDFNLSEYHVGNMLPQVQLNSDDVVSPPIMEGFVSEIDPNFKKKKGLDISQFKREKISNSIINKYKDQQKSLKHIRFNTDIDGYIWIDKKQDKVAAILSVIEKPDRTRWVQAIEIGTSYRGYGLSKMVMNIAINELHADHLSVSKKNKVAIKLYKSLGFSEYKSTDSMIMMQLKKSTSSNKKEDEIKKEGVATMPTVDDLFLLFFEAGDKDVPDLIEPIIDQLEKKGYQVKYSSPGYPDSTFKNDRDKDGVVNSKLTSTARVIFSRNYKFSKTPQGWEWKILHNGTKALYVKPYTYNEKWGTGKTAQKKWQIYYIDSLKTWVASLPNVGEEDKNSEPDENFNN